MYSRCYDRNINMSGAPATKTIYAGATLTLNNIYSTTTVSNGGLQSYCTLTTLVEIRNPAGAYVGSSDSYWGSVISSITPPTGTSADLDIVFKPSTLQFGQGVSSSFTTVRV